MEETNFLSPPPSSLRIIRDKCIGIGSFGTVNLAVNQSNGDILAVKSVDLKNSHPFQIQSLENEIQILKSLSSPYVIKFVNDEIEYQMGKSVYMNLFMEFMSGGTVTDLAQQDINGGFDEQILKSCTKCIVSGLNYIHSNGIIHCDVKGKNVLVGSTPGFAKLADFGSSKKIKDEIFNEEEKMILPRGTPLWMAPEVIRQEQQGPESDVWSLGCTIIEMITGNPPWKYSGPSTLYQIGFSNQIPEIPDQISDLGRDFLDKCLRRDPNERWTCEQLLKHPFLFDNKITESSPKSIFDWSSSKFHEEGEEDFGLISSSSANSSSNSVISAKDRIRKLACIRGVEWEIDGWEVVRSDSVFDRSGDSVVSERRNGTPLKLFDLISTTEEIIGTNWEYLNLSSHVDESEGTNLEYLNYVGHSVLFPLSCSLRSYGGGLGIEIRNINVVKMIKKSYYLWCKSLLLFDHIHILILIIFHLFSEISFHYIHMIRIYMHRTTIITRTLYTRMMVK